MARGRKSLRAEKDVVASFVAREVRLSLKKDVQPRLELQGHVAVQLWRSTFSRHAS